MYIIFILFNSKLSMLSLEILHNFNLMIIQFVNALETYLDILSN